MSHDAPATIRATTETLEQLRPALEAGAPWPLAVRFDHDPEASWGPNEVLAHTAEMLPYWLGEVERILAGPPEPVPFGRIGTDPVRIALIERDRTLPVGVLLDRVDAVADQWIARLATLTPLQRSKVGLHPRLGEMTVDSIVERQVVGHLAEHVRQLETILGLDQAPA
jgi:hypothetical protein